MYVGAEAVIMIAYSAIHCSKLLQRAITSLVKKQGMTPIKALLALL